MKIAGWNLTLFIVFRLISGLSSRRRPILPLVKALDKTGVTKII